VIRGRRGARTDESEAFASLSSTFVDLAAGFPCGRYPQSSCRFQPVKTKAICSSENRFRFTAPFRVRFRMPEKIALSMDRFAGPRSSRMRSIARRGMRGGDRCEAEQFADGAGSAGSVSLMASRLCASVMPASHSA
jgi:hypothetical protein